MKRVVLGLALCGGLFGQFQFQDVGDKSVELTEGGKPVFVYNYGMMLKPGTAVDRTRCCYLSPVYAPNGVIVTDDFPVDHPHHRGINWTWPVVIVDGTKYDLWTIKGIHARHEKWLKREATATKAVLAMREGWYVDSDQRKVVEGDVEVTVHPASGNTREMDFVVKLRPVSGAHVSSAERPITTRAMADSRSASRRGRGR